jgi:hypothetical protein
MYSFSGIVAVLSGNYGFWCWQRVMPVARPDFQGKGNHPIDSLLR